MRKWNHGWAGCALPILLLTTLGLGAPAAAQTSVQVRDMQLRHWEGSMRKVIIPGQRHARRDLHLVTRMKA